MIFLPFLGLTHLESTVQALIEILHGYALSCSSSVPGITKLYCSLLLSTDHQVSFSAKTALVRLLRPRANKHKRVFLPSPPRCSTPGDSKASSASATGGGSSSDPTPRGRDQHHGSREQHQQAIASAGGDLAGALAEVARAGGAAGGAGAAVGADLLAGQHLLLLRRPILFPNYLQVY